uniref:Uncharacterized protein n=1 Tax=Tanacetum cinerariifolium TaxID=118510 RepID=A0A6L2MW42_TANCI|nr:hypothetical protein [Tanacetum cinerariifolium]
MMGLPNEHQLKFNSIKDAKSLLAAIEKRFGGNDATKNTQRNLLKQQYENFFGSSSKSLDQTFDKLQKLVSQLELLSEVISQEDINKKFLRSLPSEWGISSSINTQNMAFVSSSSNNSNSSNGVNTAQGVNTANGVNTASSQVNVTSALNIDNLSDAVICAFLASQPNSTKLVNEDLEQIHPDDLKEMDLKWACRAPRGQDNRSRDVIRKTVPAKEGPTNYALMAYSTLSASSSDSEINVLKVDIHCRDRALTELQRRLYLEKAEKEGIQLNVNKLENRSKSLNKIIELQIMDNGKKGLGYNAVPPPLIGLFLTQKSDLSSTGLEELFNEPKTEKSKDKSNKIEPESVKKHSDAPIIQDWVSDDKDEEVEKQEVKPSLNRINFVKATTYNNPKETVKTGEQPKQNTHRKSDNQRN